MSQQGEWTQRGGQEPKTQEEEETSGDCEDINAQGLLGWESTSEAPALAAPVLLPHE